MSNRILDSSCWIEIFSSGDKSSKCEKYLKSSEKVFIPTIICYEVYKKIRTKVSEDKALSAISFLSQFELVELDRETALLAADCSINYKLAMADSTILAHSLITKSELITMDFDFSSVPDVIVIK